MERILRHGNYCDIMFTKRLINYNHSACRYAG